MARQKFSKQIKFLIRGTVDQLDQYFGTTSDAYLAKYPTSMISPFIIGEYDETHKHLIDDGIIFWSENKKVNLNSVISKLMSNEEITKDSLIVIVPWYSKPGEILLSDNLVGSSIGIWYDTLSYTVNLITKEIDKLNNKESFEFLLIDTSKPYGIEELPLKFFLDNKMRRALTWRRTSEEKKLLTEYVKKQSEEGYLFEQS